MRFFEGDRGSSGRGVVTPSIWSAMAFASKTPTQIGRKFFSSASRRITTGMFAIGSTIRALTSILTLKALLTWDPI